MVAIDVTLGNSFEMVPADLLQQRKRPMKSQQHTFATLSASSAAAAIPSGEWDQADNRNGRLHFEYLKSILLLTFIFSVLVLAVYIAGQI
jgi:hypothetical protein